ncbi:hypothetical protein H920_11688 [Fukomys damarensis]|uniref:Uncharacterized protein n=1 Tax=Fukomys damarensis TaxID=885580 RepID=A0A091D8V5_FUKDA|nr:hypothetical protein H920_11688 [Fukomys damarensis]
MPALPHREALLPWLALSPGTRAFGDPLGPPCLVTDGASGRVPPSTATFPSPPTCTRRQCCPGPWGSRAQIQIPARLSTTEQTSCGTRALPQLTSGVHRRLLAPKQGTRIYWGKIGVSVKDPIVGNVLSQDSWYRPPNKGFSCCKGIQGVSSPNSGVSLPAGLSLPVKPPHHWNNGHLEEPAFSGPRWLPPPYARPSYLSDEEKQSFDRALAWLRDPGPRGHLASSSKARKKDFEISTLIAVIVSMAAAISTTTSATVTSQSSGDSNNAVREWETSVSRRSYPGRDPSVDSVSCRDQPMLSPMNVGAVSQLSRQLTAMEFAEQKDSCPQGQEAHGDVEETGPCGLLWEGSLPILLACALCWPVLLKASPECLRVDS